MISVCLCLPPRAFGICLCTERATGIGPASTAWKAVIITVIRRPLSE